MPKSVKNPFTAFEKRIVFLCVVVYFSSYVTRINYAAVLVEYIKSTGFTKEQASLALTGLAIFYGGGQLLSGWLGDKVKPKLLITAGLAVSALMNVLLPLLRSVPVITAVWCVNGLAQAMMWPPIVKILTACLDSDKYKRGTIKVSYGAQVATIVIYLFSPVLIRTSGWQTIFYIAAACAIVTAVCVALFMPNIKKAPASNASNSEISEKTESKTSIHTAAAFPFLLLGAAMLVTVLQGVLRDGVANWLPTYLENEYGVSTEIAILMGVVPPIFSCICYEITSFISRKVIKNEYLCIAAILSVTFAASVVLSVFTGTSVVLSVLLATLITGCMHGTNVVLTCLLPPYFQSSGKVSFIAGLINSCTYIGSAISGYGFAVLSATFGWGGTIAGWAIIAAVGGIICLAFAKSWGKYSGQQQNN